MTEPKPDYPEQHELPGHAWTWHRFADVVERTGLKPSEVWERYHQCSFQGLTPDAVVDDQVVYFIGEDNELYAWTRDLKEPPNGVKFVPSVWGEDVVDLSSGGVHHVAMRWRSEILIMVGASGVLFRVLPNGRYVIVYGERGPKAGHHSAKDGPDEWLVYPDTSKVKLLTIEGE